MNALATWRDNRGQAVTARTSGVLQASVQLSRLDDMIAAAIDARKEASRTNLFESHAGLALVNAMYELTQVDGLYDLSRDVRFMLPGDEE